jgi:hypothetical protein
MSDQLQLRRGTTAENSAFTGAEGEVTVDTDKHTVVIHDGVRAGGYPQTNELTVDSRVFLFDDDVSGGSVADAYVLAPETNTIRPEQYIDGLYLSFVTNNANTGAATANFNGLGAKDIKKPGGGDPDAGEVNDRVTLIYDEANDWLELQLFQEFDPATAKTNKVQEYTAAQRGNVPSLTSTSNSIAIDLAVSNNFSHTLSENTTLAAPSNAVEGQSGVITITQDAATARTLAYNTFWDFGGGDVPAVSTALSSVNTFVYYVNAGGASATCNLIGDVS